MIKAASEHVPKGLFKIGRLEKLPFSDKSFDLVFYAHSLHETDNLGPCCYIA
ncbi:MAG: methyltransferase domain-containing protein [Candidatus Marinimicrobia bacterium]|nr:methyltransferase domain-containing protein [Candidatus Neomarinimicrobiota bacterium]